MRNTEPISHHQPEEFGKVKRRHHMSDHLPESFSLALSWLNKACTTRKDSEPEWLAEDNRETNPITIKPVPHGGAVPLGFLTYCSLPGCPFPIKSLALSAHESSWAIHFWVLDSSPVSGPGRGLPSCNSFVKHKYCLCHLSLIEISGKISKISKGQKPLE